MVDNNGTSCRHASEVATGWVTATLHRNVPRVFRPLSGPARSVCADLTRRARVKAFGVGVHADQDGVDSALRELVDHGVERPEVTDVGIDHLR
jgi:hypothetical protein